jgi:uncharacterized membrane protein YkoI
MKTQLLTLALVSVIAMPAFAQNPHSTQAAKVDIKVSRSLAHSVKVSGDSAMAIASANADNGEVSSAELKMMDKHLVYDVKVLNKSKRATDVAVDAMTGEVIKNKQYGGLKSTVVHHDENKKLLNSKRDSAAKNP